MRKNLLMSPLSQTQFTVEMTCESCATSVRDALQSVKGVEEVTTNVPSNEVHVVSNGIPPERLLQVIRDTGKQAWIHGLGAVGNVSPIGKAISFTSFEIEQEENIVTIME